MKKGDGVIEIYPIDGKNVERKWRYERGTVEGIRNKLEVRKSKNGVLEVKIAKTDDQFKTVWYSPRYNAGDNGTRVAREMGLPVGQFDYPKSIFTTRDCVFAVCRFGCAYSRLLCRVRNNRPCCSRSEPGGWRRAQIYPCRDGGPFRNGDAAAPQESCLCAGLERTASRWRATRA